MSTETNERADFEAFYAPKTDSGLLPRDANGWYEDSTAEEAWEVWQARAALSTPPAAVPADHVVDVLARDIRPQLGYADWRNFEVLIQRCRGLIAQGVAHGRITQCSRSAPIGSGAMREVVDYRLDVQAYELVKAMASSFKLNGHYMVRNESATLNLVQKWAQRAGHETTPQGRVGKFVFDLLIGQSIAIEFDEPHHGSARQSAADRQKDAEAARAGLAVLRFGLESDAIDIIGAIEASNKMPTPCAGMSCGTTTAQHSRECIAEHAAAVAGGRFVKVPEGMVMDAYAVLATEKPFEDGAKVQRMRQISGPPLWAVRHKGNCLNKSGEWEWEPMPSSRDDDFIARCRFATAEEAVAAALQGDGAC